MAPFHRNLNTLVTPTCQAPNKAGHYKDTGNGTDIGTSCALPALEAPVATVGTSHTVAFCIFLPKSFLWVWWRTEDSAMLLVPQEPPSAGGG